MKQGHSGRTRRVPAKARVLELDERIIVVLKVVVLGRNGEKLFCLSSKKASKSKKAKKTNYDAACGSPKFMSHRTAILTCPAPYIPPAAPGTCGTWWLVRGASHASHRSTCRYPWGTLSLVRLCISTLPVHVHLDYLDVR